MNLTIIRLRTYFLIFIIFDKLTIIQSKTFIIKVKDKGKLHNCMLLLDNYVKAFYFKCLNLLNIFIVLNIKIF